MGCKYNIPEEGITGLSYKELVDKYMKKVLIENSDDTVYSTALSETKQQAVFEAIKKVKLDTIREIVSAKESFDTDPNISSGYAISLSEFMNSPDFTDEGKPLIRKIQVDDYISNTAKQLMEENESLSRTQAEELAKQDTEHWNIIQQDALELHKLLSIAKLDSLSDFEDSIKGTKFEKSAGDLFSTLKSAKAAALGNIKDRARGKKSIVVDNVNIKAKLEGSNKEIVVHADMIVIDGYGDLHIFNYQVGTSTLLESNTDKMEQCKYKMALIKQALASKKIKVRNAKLHIMPIRVQYNSDYSKIDSIKVKKSMELTLRKGRYTFNKYDKIASKFIKAELGTNEISSEDVKKVSKQLELIFPDRDITIQGSTISAKEWIKRNPSKIIPSNNPDFGYYLLINGTTYEIKSTEDPENNEELIEEIKKHQELLTSNNDIMMNQLIKDVVTGVEKGNTDWYSNQYGTSAAFLNQTFSKYFAPDEDTPSEWEFVENDILNSAGILLFKHKDSYQLDIVVLSENDLTVQIKLGKGTNLLGKYYRDMDAPGQLIHYKSTWGNIEAVKAMLLINQILPKIEGDFNLGKLHIISLNGTGQGIPFSLSNFNKECFSSIIQFIKSLKGSDIQNNFSKYKFMSAYDTLEQEFKSVIANKPGLETELLDMGFNDLLSAKNSESKLNALYAIERRLRSNYSYLENFNKLGNSKIANLYKKVLEAIAYYSGEVSSIEQKRSTIDMEMFITSRIPNRNVLLIVQEYTKAINKVSEKTGNKFSHIRKIFYDYYDEIGYSRLRNSTLGLQEKAFSDLYLTDAKGNKQLRLLNPYNAHDMAQITSNRDAKQKFLKKILFEFAKIKYSMQGIAFSDNFYSENDPKLQEFIKNHNDYFDIPLEKASKSTRRAKYSPEKKAKYLLERLELCVRNPKKILEEKMNDFFNEDELSQRDKYHAEMALFNPFEIGDGDYRDTYIERCGGYDYFETNLENLFADYAEKQIETEEYNKVLLVVKGVLLQLEIMEGNPNLKEIAEQTIKRIQEFVDVNIFRKSIMEETSQKITGWLLPLRRMVSKTLIAGNIIGAVRDTFEGVWQNTLRAITKYQTDIGGAALTRAYGIVFKDMMSDGRTINIVNQLCQIYRLSNIDVSRISEGLKSERGLGKYDDWLYSSLRRPDFLNRMSLFVAKCVQDGVYDALSINDEGILEYDCTKDERYAVFLAGKKNDPRYMKQMSDYYTAVKAYNREHPDKTITYQDKLPMPYSQLEIQKIKNTADSIYGGYDKSVRAGYEHMAIGFNFGMFSTWMNGIYSNWMTKPGTYTTGEYKVDQSKDDSGNLQFFDQDGRVINEIENADGTKTYIYDGTDEKVPEEIIDKIQPMIDKVPIPVQGIFYSVKDVLKTLITNDGTSVKEIWNNPVDRKNLEKLMADILAWIFFSSLFGFVLTPGYNDFKKTMKQRSFLTNAAVEIFYKGVSRSYDGFRGIYNVVEYLGENANPPIYSQNIKLLKSIASTAFGEKTFGDMLTGNVAVFRAFQDSYKAEKRK